MNSLMKNTTLLTMFLVPLFVICGCDDDSDPDSVPIVEGDVILNDMWKPGSLHDKLDSWEVTGFGDPPFRDGDYTNVYMMAFFFRIYSINGVALSPGEEVIVTQVDHDNEDPLGLNGNDIWNEWGFMEMRHASDSSETSKTRITGKVAFDNWLSFAVGLGHIDALYGGFPEHEGLDPLPGSDIEENYAGWITTRVHLRVRVPSRGFDEEIHVVFRRVSGQDFLSPKNLGSGQIWPSIYSICYTGLMPAPDYYDDPFFSFGLGSSSMIPLSKEELMTMSNEDLLRPYGSRIQDIPHIPLAIGNRTITREIFPDRNSQKDFKFKKSKGKSKDKSDNDSSPSQMIPMSASASGFGISDRTLYYMQADLTDPNDPNSLEYAFEEVDPAVGFASALFGEPNSIEDSLVNAMPYVFRVTADSPIPITEEDLYATMELQALDPNGLVMNRMPIEINFVSQSPDGLQVTGQSDWWIPTLNPELAGTITDSNGIEWIVFYMPEGSRIRISWQKPFGDINHDGLVNFLDFAKFAMNFGGEFPYVDLECVNFPGESPEDVGLDELDLFTTDWLYVDIYYDPNDL